MVFWVLSLLLSPAPTTAHLMVGLVVAAALLIVLAVARLATAPGPRAVPQPHQRTGTDDLPRLLDPDAPGRARPRAPTVCPTAA